jgi:16S rRNA (uracil1498-N3)-methyltransferase
MKAKTAVLSREESKHLKNVLRLKKGDLLTVFNGEGDEYDGQVASLAARVEVSLGKKRRSRFLGPISVSLAQSLPKKKKMDFIIAKACELGVGEIFPLESERSAFRITGPASARVAERWQRIAVAACKQCRLDWIPRIHKPVRLKGLLDQVKGFEAVFVPHPDEKLPHLSEVVGEIKAQVRAKIKREEPREKARKILVVIGPEGGFSEREVALMREKKARLVHFGDLILRTETAAVVTVSLIKYAFEL